MRVWLIVGQGPINLFSHPGASSLSSTSIILIIPLRYPNMRFSTSSGHDESGNGTAVRTAIDTAIETVKFVKGIVPFEPASGALESLGVLLQMAQVC